MRLITLILCCLLLGFSKAYPNTVGSNGETLAENNVVDSLKRILPHVRDTQRIDVLFLLVKHTMNNKPDIARLYAIEAKQLSESIGNKKMQCRAITQLGHVYATQGDYKNALIMSFMVLRMYEKDRDTINMAYTYNFIGSIYSSLGKNKISREYLYRALKTDRSNKGLLEMVYNNLGNIEHREQNFVECIRLYKEALSISMEHHREPKVFALLYQNIGESYYTIKQLDSAKHYFLKMLDTSDYMIDRVGAYSGLGKIALQETNLQEAEYYLLKAKTSGSEKFSFIEEELLKNISDLYIAKKDYRKALHYYTQYKVLEDSRQNDAMNKQVSELQIKYETEKKDEQIRVADKNREIVQDKANQDKLFRNFIIVILFLVICIGVIVGRNIILKQKAKYHAERREIEYDNVRLLRENTEAKYEVLKSKVNPHFLFNSLNILSTIVMKDQEAAVEFIENFSDLYRMTLETGDKKLISVRKEMVLVNNYLYLQKKRFTDNLIIDVQINSDYEDYMLPPFVLQMLVENAIKHNIIATDEERLYITIYTAGDEIIIINNLQKKEIKMASTATGHKSITDRYRILGNKLPVFTETATEYIVRIPLLTTQQYAITES